MLTKSKNFSSAKIFLCSKITSELRIQNLIYILFFLLPFGCHEKRSVTRARVFRKLKCDQPSKKPRFSHESYFKVIKSVVESGKRENNGMFDFFNENCSLGNIFSLILLNLNIIDTFIFDHLSHSTLLLIVFNFSNFLN